MKARKGFTLVELSIVLVIIGLLIGGILVAQSMIGTTKNQALIRQIGQFDAAIANFQTKFNSLPGDSKKASSGNGDGMITDVNGALADFSGEIASFWPSLSLSGLTNPTGVAYSSGPPVSGIVTGTHIPSIPGDNSIGIIAYGYAYNGIPNQNFYSIGKMSSAADGTAIAVAPAFTAADALAIDTKIDDANPNSGNVTGNDLLTLIASMHSEDSSSCSTAATTYNTAYSTLNCALNIRFGTTTGNPQ